MEKNGDYFGRLAVLEEVKSLPGGAVWDYYCLSLGVPPGLEWLPEITAYERAVLSRRRP
jgi:L-rhamnose isomerase